VNANLLRIARISGRAVGYGTAGVLLTLMVGAILYLNGREDLKPWHETVLESEFSVASGTTSLDAYVALEDQLFEELDARIRDEIDPADRTPLQRFHRGSLSDPERWERDWNRTYVLPTAQPRAGVLLLHGLSDSPYSLRHIARRLHAGGAWVVGLRLPGHGTAPSGLVDITWQDMAAAVELAMRDLRQHVGPAPIHLVGYSNGAALAVNYALQGLRDPGLPRADRLVLISPAIGVSPVAGLAVWQARLGRLLWLDKLAWNAILPEYDPFKYQSFAVNAGDIAYQITREIRTSLATAGNRKGLDAFPETLAFMSAVDATVSTRAVVENLFARLPERGHELVVFDLNRRAGLSQILANDPQAALQRLLNDETLPFDFSLITNRDEATFDTVVLTNPAGPTLLHRRELGLPWPSDVYSLSHVALPFPERDPLYGGPAAKPSPGIRIGANALRGEIGALQIPAATMLRQRWNPFYDYLEARILAELSIP